MTSSTSPRQPAVVRTARALLAVVGAAVLVPALSSVAVAADTGTTCQQVDAGTLGREGSTRVPLDVPGLVLVRDRDQVTVEGTSATVTSLTVTSGAGARTPASGKEGTLRAELHLAGYDHVEVCWDTPPVLAPRPAVTEALPETAPELVVTDPEPRPTEPGPATPQAPVAVAAGPATAVQVEVPTTAAPEPTGAQPAAGDPDPLVTAAPTPATPTPGPGATPAAASAAPGPAAPATSSHPSQPAALATTGAAPVAPAAVAAVCLLLGTAMCVVSARTRRSAHTATARRP